MPHRFGLCAFWKYLLEYLSIQNGRLTLMEYSNYDPFIMNR